MPDPEYFVPFYKTCPVCHGTGETEVPGLHDVTVMEKIGCHNCSGSGIVQVLIELYEFAHMTDMNEAAFHYLKCALEKD